MDGTDLIAPNIPAVKRYNSFEFVPIGDQVQQNLYEAAKRVMALTKGWSNWARRFSFPALVVDPNGEIRYSKFSHEAILGNDLIRLQSQAPGLVRGIDVDLAWFLREEHRNSHKVNADLRRALFDFVRAIQDYKRVATLSQGLLGADGLADPALQLQNSDVLSLIYVLCGHFDNSKVGWHSDRGTVIRVVNGKPATIFTEQESVEREATLSADDVVRAEGNEAVIFGPKAFHRGPYESEATYREMTTSAWERYPRELIARGQAHHLDLTRHL